MTSSTRRTATSTYQETTSCVEAAGIKTTATWAGYTNAPCRRRASWECSINSANHKTSAATYYYVHHYVTSCLLVVVLIQGHRDACDEKGGLGGSTRHCSLPHRHPCHIYITFYSSPNTRGIVCWLYVRFADFGCIPYYVRVAVYFADRIWVYLDLNMYTCWLNLYLKNHLKYIDFHP